jgi:hypothetical protein
MDTFLKEVKKLFEVYNERIVNELDIEPERIKKLFKNFFDGVKAESKKKAKTETKKEEKKEVEKVEKKEKKVQLFCTYLLKRGERKNEECGKAVKSGIYCTTHKKYEGVEEETEEKTRVPKSKDTTPKSSPVNKKYTINKHPSGRFWHSLTGMVFKSTEEKAVIGRIKDDEFYPLNDEDIETCKKWGFKMDKPDNDEIIRLTLTKLFGDSGEHYKKNGGELHLKLSRENINDLIGKKIKVYDNYEDEGYPIHFKYLNEKQMSFHYTGGVTNLTITNMNKDYQSLHLFLKNLSQSSTGCPPDPLRGGISLQRSSTNEDSFRDSEEEEKGTLDERKDDDICEESESEYTDKIKDENVEEILNKITTETKKKKKS